jgi:O-6-methylguanine DNA methyltransferase
VQFHYVDTHFGIFKISYSGDILSGLTLVDKMEATDNLPVAPNIKNLAKSLDIVFNIIFQIDGKWVFQAENTELIKKHYLEIINFNKYHLPAELTDFQRAIYQVLPELKPTMMTAYSQLAYRIGKPNAARAVGTALNKNPIMIIIPCHRIVSLKKADRFLYAFGPDRKKCLLALEANLFNAKG